MKFLGKVLLTLLLLLVLSIVLCYVLLQTSWAAGWLSRWVSDNSEYRLSLGKIDHSWSQPGQVSFTDVTLGRAKQPGFLIAQQAVLGLSWRQLTEPRHFLSLNLQNGSLTLNNSTSPLPLQADTLRLTNMALNTTIEPQNKADQWKVTGQQVTGGLIPWQPLPGNSLGENAQFQFSAGSLTINGITAEKLYLQGSIQKNALTLSNFGADIAQGELTGNASQSADGSWLVDRLRLSNIRLQTPASLEDVWNTFLQLPPITLKRFDLIDARVEGKNWAFNDLDLTLKNITFKQGDWQSDEGELSLNAGDIIKGNIHLIDPIATFTLSPPGVAINQFSTRWQDGLLRTQGNWQRDSHRLQLDELTLVALVYTLPTDWKQQWQQTLPNWLSEVYISKLNANRNLLIDISPDFPFQITSLDAAGTNLLLAKNHQWGMWSGSLMLNAGNATFNKNDVRRPSLALSANEQQITVSDLSAFTKEGLLEATATIDQTPGRALSLALTGRSVDLNILQNWGWSALPLQGLGNLKLRISGNLTADKPLKPTINGSLQATDSHGQQVNQTMQNGEVHGVAGQ
ncbi:TPA: AsmA family protein [Yersinia enterocolitica]|uniref:AsmA family protein n=1 Tax=Yersinia enterocolitica TaxID=630 RepID=UPI0021E8A8D2|nr:AsmA family protein [Yersinia enterocolitica]EKN3948614.1 AsmA family protein [Yersinia enterocolitica]EKN5912372.1 AsmA family protein [Yersinia enterocolitica]EKN6318726.1 AsmA family protein [Yersinia enterocolitica]UYJ97386.1 AsmA family protein [Yersinia enterocolitica]HDL7738952.1 AsmA family protein [Yersinia enterocolitica]